MFSLKPRFFIPFFLFTATSLFAQNDQMPSRDPGMWQTIVMIGIAMLFFYFILWRPEQKRRQALEEQRSKLKKGDRVVAMGILGKVSKISEQSVVLEMVDGGKIEVLTGAITEVVEPAAETEESQ